MTNKNTFGVHFVLRTNKTEDEGKFPVYARITVNQTRCEFSLKHSLRKNDWNFGKGAAKPKNDELREFNSYLQEMQGIFARHYRELQLQDLPFTAKSVKSAFIGIEEEKTTYTLLWLAKQHNTMMQKSFEAR